MSVWIIRAAQDSDVDQLMKLRLALQEHLEQQNPDLWRLSADGRSQLKEQLVQLLNDNDACVLVALDGDGIIVGMTIGQIQTSERHIPANTGSIGLLFISESWRRGGIGTELVNRLCRFFASHGVEDISVRYVIGNDEATRFWSKLGFLPRIITAGTKLRDLDRKTSITADDDMALP